MPGPPIIPVPGSIQIAYYTLADWTAWDDILLEGQMSIVSDAATDDVKFKVGDGSTNWTSLPYYNPVDNATYSALTANTVPYINGSKKLVSSAVTATELGYISGLTSNAQAQINALQTGMFWKAAVRVATTANGTLATDFENGDTIDGVVLATGDRILIKDQSTASENGIYVIAASGAPTRATDFDAGADNLAGATVSVQEGTTNGEKKFTCSTNNPITIGATNIAFVEAGGTTYIGTSNRITVTGNQIDISSSYVGQNTITTLGTISTGTWQGTAIDHTYIASMTSAQLAGIVSDETGSGALAFATSPTFTTDITTPKIIGGTGETSKITNQASSNASVTSTAIAHEWLIGNSGGTTGMKMYHDGTFNIGNKTNVTQRIVRIGQDTAWMDIGSVPLQTSLIGIWLNKASITDNTTYWVASDGTSVTYNSSNVHNFTQNGGLRFRVGTYNTSDVRLGIGAALTSPSAMAHIISTTEQFRAGYDTSNYWSAATGSTGGVTFDGAGTGAGFEFKKRVWNHGNSAVSSNTAFGKEAGINISTSDNTTVYGATAGKSITSGTTNTLFGSNTGYLINTGEGNTGVGPNVFAVMTTGNYNSAFGRASQSLGNGSNNSSFGFASLYSNTSDNSSAFGAYAAYANTTGDRIVAFGGTALYTNTTGSYSTAIGYGALYSSNGDRNVALGYNAGYYETGSDKLFIDNRARGSESAARTDSLIYAVFDATVGSQEIRLNAGKVLFPHIPTSSAGLATGQIWNDSGTLKIV